MMRRVPICVYVFGCKSYAALIEQTGNVSCPMQRLQSLVMFEQWMACRHRSGGCCWGGSAVAGLSGWSVGCKRLSANRRVEDGFYR